MKILTFGTLLLSLAVVAQACWLGDWWRSYMSDEEQVKGSTPAEMAEALTRLYKFFLKIGYVTEEEMRWPPHNTSDLDVDMCRLQGLGEDAIALLQIIPWSTSHCHLDFESVSVNFSDEDEVSSSRTPDFPYDDPSEDNVLIDPWVLVIAYRQGFGETISLDTRKGILSTDTAYTLKELKTDELADLHADIQNPVEYFDARLQDYISLEGIPVNGIILNKEVSPSQSWNDASVCHQKTKESLPQYGWPDAFRVSDWRSRDFDGLWEQWTKEIRKERRALRMREEAEQRLAQLNIQNSGNAAGRER